MCRVTRGFKKWLRACLGVTDGYVGIIKITCGRLKVEPREVSKANGQLPCGIY